MTKGKKLESRHRIKRYKNFPIKKIIIQRRVHSHVEWQSTNTTIHTNTRSRICKGVYVCGCVRNYVWMCLFLYSRVLTSVQSRRVKHNLSYSGIMPSNKRNRIHWTNSYSMHMLGYMCSYVGVWLLSGCPEYWEETLWLEVPLCLWSSVRPSICLSACLFSCK